MPSDMEDKVRPISGRDVSGEIEAGGAFSGGTTNKELESAAESPKSYARGLQGSQVLREVAVSSAHAAVFSGVMGGAVSFIRNTYSYARGDVGTKEALKNVAADAAKSGTRGGTVAGIGTIIRQTARVRGVPNALGQGECRYGCGVWGA